jgi:hypothetical protein
VSGAVLAGGVHFIAVSNAAIRQRGIGDGASHRMTHHAALAARIELAH